MAYLVFVQSAAEWACDLLWGEFKYHKIMQAAEGPWHRKGENQWDLGIREFQTKGLSNI